MGLFYYAALVIQWACAPFTDLGNELVTEIVDKREMY